MNAVILATLLKKECLRIIRIWPQTLLPSVVTTLLYFLIFGNFMGGRIGSMQNVPYIAFIIPGMIILSITTNAYSNVSASLFSAKFQKSIEEMTIAPMPAWVFLLGFVAGGVFRGLFVGLMVYVMSLFFYVLPISNLPLVIATAVLTATIFSLGGFLNALYANSFDDISIIPSFVITPLTYLGGVFYTPELLSSFWQKILYSNPLFYLILLFRNGFLGQQSSHTVIAAFTGLLALTAIFWWLCLRLVKKGYGLKG